MSAPNPTAPAVRARTVGGVVRPVASLDAARSRRERRRAARRSASLIRRRHRNDWWTDFFCGAGGASTGLVRAGFHVRVAANHWDVAVATHEANHPDTEHLCENINTYDMRALARTRFLWASVICTEESPAGGKKRSRRPRGQLDLLTHARDGGEGGDGGELEDVADEGFVRTRACALDVIRATEVHGYDLVVVENVCDFYEDWALFDWWIDGMRQLGYTARVFSINSAHVSSPGNEAAPQWRDRIYVVFAAEGVPMPDLTPRPAAFCPACGVDVEAVQSWKNGSTVGKYRQQYDYRCPHPACGHRMVEPYISPAATAIDWSDLGTPIGERKRPLVPATMRKIQIGLTQYADLLEPIMVTTTHGQDGGPRAFPARMAPLPTRTTKIGDGFALPPGAEIPGGPVVPASFIHEQRGGGSLYRPITHPLATLSTGRNHGLVVPYRKGYARPTGDPLLTLATRDSAALAIPATDSTGGPATLTRGGVLVPTYDIREVRYRMLRPREHLTAQRFPGLYVVKGTGAEQTMQAGNAVSCNVAQWIGERIGAQLGSVAA